MKAIPPKRDDFVLPADTVEVTYAADQPQYNDLPCLKTKGGSVIIQYQLTAEELEKLRTGALLTVVLLTFNTPLQPICVHVGGMDLQQLPTEARSPEEALNWMEVKQLCDWPECIGVATTAHAIQGGGNVYLCGRCAAKISVPLDQITAENRKGLEKAILTAGKRNA